MKDAVAIAYDRTLTALLRCQHENVTCTGNPRQRRYWQLPEEPSVAGIFVQPTAAFHAGDVVLGWFCNGQAERLSVSGWSSKKRAPIVDLMVQFARFPSMDSWMVRCPAHGRLRMLDHWKRHARCRLDVSEPSSSYENRTRLRLEVFELPGQRIVGRPLARYADPDVRELRLSGLRAAVQRATARSKGAARRERAPDSATPVRTDSGAAAGESE